MGVAKKPVAYAVTRLQDASEQFAMAMSDVHQATASLTELSDEEVRDALIALDPVIEPTVGRLPQPHIP